MTTVFTPTGNTTLSASSSTTRVALPTLGGSAQSGSRSVRFGNALNEAIWLAFGGDTIEATTSGLWMPAGGVEVFEISPAATHVAAITASGSGTVYITAGRGG